MRVGSLAINNLPDDFMLKNVGKFDEEGGGGGHIQCCLLHRITVGSSGLILMRAAVEKFGIKSRRKEVQELLVVIQLENVL
jgi:hypothetical protein